MEGQYAVVYLDEMLHKNMLKRKNWCLLMIRCIILDRQSKFIKKMENGDYITDVINMAISVNSPMGKRIVTLRQNSSPHRPNFMQNLIDTVITSESSRYAVNIYQDTLYLNLIE